MPAAHRDHEVAAREVVLLLSKILSVRKLLSPSSFHAVPKARIGMESYRDWPELINPCAGTTDDGVTSAPPGLEILLKKRLNPDLSSEKIIERLSNVLPLIENDALIKIHICLFRLSDKRPEDLEERFTIKLSYDDHDAITIYVKWAGTSGILPKRKAGDNIDALLARLRPHEDRVFFGIWHEVRLGTKRGHDGYITDFPLDEAEKKLAQKDGYSAEDCFPIRVLPAHVSAASPVAAPDLVSSPKFDPAASAGRKRRASPPPRTRRPAKKVAAAGPSKRVGQRATRDQGDIDASPIESGSDEPVQSQPLPSDSESDGWYEKVKKAASLHAGQRSVVGR